MAIVRTLYNDPAHQIQVHGIDEGHPIPEEWFKLCDPREDTQIDKESKYGALLHYRTTSTK